MRLRVLLLPLLLASCTTFQPPPYPGRAAIAALAADVRHDVVLTVHHHAPVRIHAGEAYARGLPAPLPGRPAVTTCLTLEADGVVRMYALTATVDTDIYAFISGEAAVGATARARITNVDDDDERPTLVERPSGQCTDAP